MVLCFPRTLVLKTRTVSCAAAADAVEVVCCIREAGRCIVKLPESGPGRAMVIAAPEHDELRSRAPDDDTLGDNDRNAGPEEAAPDEDERAGRAGLQLRDEALLLPFCGLCKPVGCILLSK